MSDVPRIDLLRCPLEGSELVVKTGDGVTCLACGATYSSSDGIVDLTTESIHAESDRERKIRDDEAVARGEPRYVPATKDGMAVQATLNALGVEPRHTVLEMGAGTGRFTRPLAERCAHVVALDLSRSSLVVAMRHVGRTGSVTFLRADVADPVAARGAYDRVLGTLASNLPDADARRISYERAARCLAPDGRFVFTAHHFDLRARLQGTPREGRYSERGIFRRLLTRGEVLDEAGAFFREVSVRPINVALPFARRLGVHGQVLDRIGQRTPLMRDFGSLLLVDARRPRRV